MGEYISKEAVLRYLEGYSEKELNGPSSFGMITSHAIDKVARAISEMPSVFETDAGWISVKDKFPEESIPVLIYAAGHRVTAYYDKVKEVFRLTEDENMYYLTEAVTHWRPLPETPEKED